MALICSTKVQLCVYFHSLIHIRAGDTNSHKGSNKQYIFAFILIPVYTYYTGIFTHFISSDNFSRMVKKLISRYMVIKWSFSCTQFF